MRGELEVTAVSIHAYAYLARQLRACCRTAPRWAISTVRVSSRDEPMSRRRRSQESASRFPGPLTSAYLALRLYEPDFTPVPTPFDQIEDAVEHGDVDLGLLIHEGQLTFGDRGLHLVADMGEWWFAETGLPSPVRRQRRSKGSWARLSPARFRATCEPASRTD